MLTQASVDGVSDGTATRYGGWVHREGLRNRRSNPSLPLATVPEA